MVTTLKKAVSGKHLVGHDVTDVRGEDAGEIYDVIMDAGTGEAAYAVIGSGGFLGLREHKAIVPWQALTLEDEGGVILGVERERLRDAPSYDPDARPDFADEKWARSVHDYWGVPFGAAAGTSARTEMRTEMSEDRRVRVEPHMGEERRMRDEPAMGAERGMSAEPPMGAERVMSAEPSMGAESAMQEEAYAGEERRVGAERRHQERRGMGRTGEEPAMQESSGEEHHTGLLGPSGDEL